MNAKAMAAIALWIVARAPAAGDVSKEIDAELKKISKTYGLAISSETLTSDLVIHCSSATEAESIEYAPVLIKEFTRYPPELVKRAKLKRIVLCKKLAVFDQPRAAVPDRGNGFLYLDVCIGRENAKYRSHVIHHDFYHMVDFQQQFRDDQDIRWSSLNAADFQYGAGGDKAQADPLTGVLTERYPGFLNHYSTTAIIEDKAEIFANLIMNPDYMAAKMKRDAIVRAKVTLLKERLLKFCPEMNEAFWDKIRAPQAGAPDRPAGLNRTK